MNVWSIVLVVAGVLSIVGAVMSSRDGLKSADGFRRLEGMAWACIDVTVVYGCLIMALLNVIIDKLG